MQIRGPSGVDGRPRSGENIVDGSSPRARTNYLIKAEWNSAPLWASEA